MARAACIGSSRCWKSQLRRGRIAYGPVELGDVETVLDAMVADGGDHKLRVGLPEDHPFLKKQTRLTFARCGIVDPRSLDDYKAHDGYKGLAKALANPAGIVEEITQSGLRGRGGAGFPTGIKWKTVADAKADRKYIVCNADEGDSGTFADRMIMEGDPFVLIEGMTIAGIAVGATKGYIYVRSEYPHAIAVYKRRDPRGAPGRHARQERRRVGVLVRSRSSRRRRRLCVRRGNVVA